MKKIWLIILSAIVLFLISISGQRWSWILISWSIVIIGLIIRLSLFLLRKKSKKDGEEIPGKRLVLACVVEPIIGIIWWFFLLGFFGFFQEVGRVFLLSLLAFFVKIFIEKWIMESILKTTWNKSLIPVVLFNFCVGSIVLCWYFLG